MQADMLHERLKLAAGSRTYRDLAIATSTHPESVRRYMQGQPPSLEFISGLCAALGVSTEWMLTGRGPMRTSDLRSHALRQANPAELLSAVAATLERLTERVERLEVFLQTLELRLRADVKEGPHGEASSVSVPERLDHIAGAVAERTSSHAD